MITADGDLLRDIALMPGLETGNVSVALGPYPSVMSCYSAAARLGGDHPEARVSRCTRRLAGRHQRGGRKKSGHRGRRVVDAVLNDSLATEVVDGTTPVSFCRPDHPILARRRASDGGSAAIPLGP